MSIAPNEKILYAVKEVSAPIHTNQTYVHTLIKTGLLPTLKLESENPHWMIFYCSMRGKT